MAKVLLDTEDGAYYHPTCVTDAANMETIEEDGMNCAKCGMVIEDEGPEDPQTIDDEDDEEEKDGGPA